jgi:uncharacterized protein YndB with AHSA1/START domain
MSSEKKHVFQVEIEAPAEKVWDAIINPDQTRQYYYGGAFHADLRPGGSYVFDMEDGSQAIKGQILEVEPPRRLVATFSSQWDDAMRAEPPSRVTWEVEQRGAMSVVTVVHDQLEDAPVTYERVSSGWSPILTGLKTFVETGKAAEVPA